MSVSPCKNLVVLGATGSIGVSTLEVAAEHPERFRVLALSGGNNLERLAHQVRRFRPRLVGVLTPEHAARLVDLLEAPGPEIVSGIEGLIRCATCVEADMVVSAIVGAAGLVPTMAAIEAGKDVALANKETLVTAGPLVMAGVERKGVRLFPVDSEHSAIFQSLLGHNRGEVRRLILTASGGPLRAWRPADLARATPEDALAHPNWQMGRKISIDSATMMNKGLEVIEARWLFDLPGEQIAVHIHPQSIVHSMVEYQDGSVIAQLGIPDMKTPIAYALSYPERLPLKLPPLDLCGLGDLSFENPEPGRFPCLDLAYAALGAGGTAPTVLNAANEIAVEAFLARTIGFLDIPAVIQGTLDRHAVAALHHIDDVLRADRWARDEARRLIATH